MKIEKNIEKLMINDKINGQSYNKVLKADKYQTFKKNSGAIFFSFHVIF